MKATKFSQYLQSREELKFVDAPHWIYVLEAAVISILILLTAFFISGLIGGNALAGMFGAGGFDALITTIIGYSTLVIEWGAILFVVIYFVNRVIYYLTTYVFASDRRLYLKTGLVHVTVKEISFDEIRATHINYGLFGRFLGYGKLIMDARFVDDANLPYTYCPETFGKLIHYDNDLVDDVNLSFALQEMKGDKESDVPRAADHHNEIDQQGKQTEALDGNEQSESGDGVLDTGYVQNKDKNTDREFEEYTDKDQGNNSVPKPAKRVISRTNIR